MTSQICKRDHFRLVSQSASTLRVETFNPTDCFPISSHDNFLPGTFEVTTSPRVSNPMISMPTELVRPVSISCLWRKRFTRALPRPSSRPPLTRTPSIVLLPASTKGHHQSQPDICIPCAYRCRRLQFWSRSHLQVFQALAVS